MLESDDRAPNDDPTLNDGALDMAAAPPVAAPFPPLHCGAQSWWWRRGWPPPPRGQYSGDGRHCSSIAAVAAGRVVGWIASRKREEKGCLERLGRGIRGGGGGKRYEPPARGRTGTAVLKEEEPESGTSHH